MVDRLVGRLVGSTSQPEPAPLPSRPAAPPHPTCSARVFFRLCQLGMMLPVACRPAQGKEGSGQASAGERGVRPVQGKGGSG